MTRADAHPKPAPRSGEGPGDLIGLLAGLVALVIATPAYVTATVFEVTDPGDDGSPGQLRALNLVAADGDTIVTPAGMEINLQRG